MTSRGNGAHDAQREGATSANPGSEPESLVDRLLAAAGGSRRGAIHTTVRTHEDRGEIAKDPDTHRLSSHRPSPRGLPAAVIRLGPIHTDADGVEVYPGSTVR
jgi:hypothetical protein